MKPAQIKAEQERVARMKLRKMGRQIPDNATFMSILMQIPDSVFRHQFYYRIRRYLRFEPIPLEALDIHEN